MTTVVQPAQASAGPPLLDEFALALIRRKAWQLAKSPGFSRQDLPDLEQELALIALRRLAAFDPHRSHHNAFVTTVVERFAGTILEHRRAQMRTYRRFGGSLGRLDLEEDLGPSQQARRTGQYPRSAQEAWELAQDMATVLAQMPPCMRRVCEILMNDTKSAAARQLGISQGSLYEILGRIEAQFEKGELRDYLPTFSTNRAAFR